MASAVELQCAAVSTKQKRLQLSVKLSKAYILPLTFHRQIIPQPQSGYRESFCHNFKYWSISKILSLIYFRENLQHFLTHCAYSLSNVQTRVRLVTEDEYPLKDSFAKCSLPSHNQTTGVTVTGYTCMRYVRLKPLGRDLQNILRLSYDKIYR